MAMWNVNKSYTQHFYVKKVWLNYALNMLIAV